MPRRGVIYTVAPSPKDINTIWCGTDDGLIHITKDGGYSWNQINQTAPKIVSSKKSKTATPDSRLMTQNLWVSRVIASEHQEGRVYATLNGYRYDDFAAYVYVSEDYGASWKKLGADLPHEPVNVIREDPKNENIIYIGTDGGLYVSFDAGNSFMMWNKGLPKSVPVHDIVIHAGENEIVLGTHGRSIYIAKLSEVQKKAEKK